MILIQSKNYTSCNVCNKLNNGKFLFQNLICVYFLFEIRILKHIYLDKYELDLIATDYVIVMLHYISVDQKGGCNVYREGLGTRRVAVISIGRV